jgi:hypothetical protein
VKPIGDDPSADSALRCAVVGFGSIRVTADQLSSLRQNPGSFPGQSISPSFLKHADEQTVVSVAALFQGIERHGLAETCFTDWGILAAPRYLGRITTAHAFQRFAAEGAWGISPHLIPHRTLHAISGTISQALQIHGPNLGVGGGPEADIEVMRVAPAFLADPNLPGLWVVMSGWNPEPIPAPPIADASSGSTNGFHPVPYCQAVAIALTSPPAEWEGLELQFHLHGAGNNGWAIKHSLPAFRLESLQAAFESPSSRDHWALGNNGTVKLVHVGVGAEITR